MSRINEELGRQTESDYLIGSGVLSLQTQYAKVEIMGHVSWIGLAGPSHHGPGFTRVDVIDGDGAVLFTKHYSAPAIYCITPIDRDTALLLAADRDQVPDIPWKLREQLEHEVREETLRAIQRQAQFLTDEQLPLILAAVTKETEERPARKEREKTVGEFSEAMVGEFSDDEEPF